MSDQDLICVCMSVTRGEIKEAVHNGAKTLEELKAQLLCCTGCGTCAPKVAKILADETSASAAPEKSAS